MSVIAKNKSSPASLKSSADLFGRLGQMLADPDTAWQASKIRMALGKSVQQLRDHMSGAEKELLRKVVQELVSQVDHLVSSSERSSASSMPDTATVERARAEDAMGQRMLDAASRRRPAAVSTRQSIHQGNTAIARSMEVAATATAARIANGELISSGQLQHALGVKRQAISAAVKARRLFAIVGPSGENFYPAYYADQALDRRKLEQVSKALGTMPAASKHHFFTSRSSILGETPLQALRKGREADVLAAAAGFAER